MRGDIAVMPRGFSLRHQHLQIAADQRLGQIVTEHPQHSGVDGLNASVRFSNNNTVRRGFHERLKIGLIFPQQRLGPAQHGYINHMLHHQLVPVCLRHRMNNLAGRDDHFLAVPGALAEFTAPFTITPQRRFDIRGCGREGRVQQFMCPPPDRLFRGPAVQTAAAFRPQPDRAIEVMYDDRGSTRHFE